ncbi:MAG: hypothetical protein U1E15_00185 [Hyphomicrobiales bacterium]
MAQILGDDAGHGLALADIMAGLRDTDAVVRMRCGDVAEKISRQQPFWLQPFKRKLIALAEETPEQEMRWHLSQMLPRLQLAAAERSRLFQCLETYRTDKSRIVRVSALQGLFDLALTDESLRPAVRLHLETALSTGSPAEKARARKLGKTTAE